MGYHTLATSAGVINATAEHPFWVVNRGWVAAEKLQAGDTVASYNGTALVYDNGYQDESVPVFNFTVANSHTYFVGDRQDASDSLWVHNASRQNCWGSDELGDVTSNFSPFILEDGRRVYDVEIDGQPRRVYAGVEDGRWYDYDANPPTIDRPTRVSNRGNTNSESGATPDVNENRGAEILNDYGFDVTHQRRDPGGPGSHPRADYSVDGLGQVDEYSPRLNTSNSNVASAIHEKRKQASTILVQTDKSLEDMGVIAASTWGKAGSGALVNKIIFAISSGVLFVFNRP